MKVWFQVALRKQQREGICECQINGHNLRSRFSALPYLGCRSPAQEENGEVVGDSIEKLRLPHSRVSLSCPSRMIVAGGQASAKNS